MSANLSKETAGHSARWHRWTLGDESEIPMRWDAFCDGMEKQRDSARNIAEQYISKANTYDAEVLGYRETIKALEDKLAQVKEQLASKDGYPAQPVDDGGPVHPTMMSNGIYLRDWFAGMALQGMMSAPGAELFCAEEVAAHDITSHAFLVSDCMLAARNGKEGA